LGRSHSHPLALWPDDLYSLISTLQGSSTIRQPLPKSSLRKGCFRNYGLPVYNVPLVYCLHHRSSLPHREISQQSTISWHQRDSKKSSSWPGSRHACPEVHAEKCWFEQVFWHVRMLRRRVRCPISHVGEDLCGFHLVLWGCQ